MVYVVCWMFIATVLNESNRIMLTENNVSSILLFVDLH